MTYHQASGCMEDATGRIIGVGYSGSPLGKNNPAMQQAQNVGPIPRGIYTIGEAFTDGEKGPLVMRLTPAAGNEMFDRDGFLIHGDSIDHPGTASEGCIILDHATRLAISESLDRRLEVVV